MTPDQVRDVTEALINNPPIPVDLARITRVFSTKLQFVELKVTFANISQREIGLSSKKFNADANEHLQTLINSRLKAFLELKDIEVPVPLFVRGEQAFDRYGDPLMEPASESVLKRERQDIEREFLYSVSGFGRLMERERTRELKEWVEAFTIRLIAHSNGIRKAIADQASAIVDEAIDLVARRMLSSEASRSLNPMERQELAKDLRNILARVEGETPKVSLVFKECTHEQTRCPEFKERLERSLPHHVRSRLGPWFEDFVTAREASDGLFAGS